MEEEKFVSEYFSQFPDFEPVRFEIMKKLEEETMRFLVDEGYIIEEENWTE